jgi:hypothetical protein
MGLTRYTYGVNSVHLWGLFGTLMGSTRYTYGVNSVHLWGSVSNFSYSVHLWGSDGIKS